MPEYAWSPPQHPDPAEDQPIGCEPDPTARPAGLPPVWVQVEFTRTGLQRLKAFVEQASADRVYVQLVHMGFAHRVWLTRDRVTQRTLARRDR